MTEFLKKAIKATGGGKHAGIMAVLLALGIILTVFGADGMTLFEARTDEAKKIVKLCEKVCLDTEVFVTVNTDTTGRVTGIAVVCEKGNSAGVKLTICEMLSTLYSIPSSQIYVTGFM